MPKAESQRKWDSGQMQRAMSRACNREQLPIVWLVIAYYFSDLLTMLSLEIKIE